MMDIWSRYNEFTFLKPAGSRERLLPSKWGAFYEYDFLWLCKERYEADPGDFVPREWYGKYIKDLLAKPQFQHSGDALKLEQGQVIDATAVSSDEVEIELKSGKRESANALVLAVGNLPRTQFNQIPVAP